MSGSDIEVLTTDVRSDHLLIAETLLHLAQMILQTEAQLRSLRQPDRQTLTHLLGEHEELHLLTDLTVVAFLGLLKHHEVFVEHLLLGEGDTIQALHLLTGCITTPESTSHAGQLHCLDLTCIHEVRTATEVGEVTLCIGSDRTVFQVLIDMFALVGLTVGSKLLQGISLSHLTAHHRLLLASQFLHLVLDLSEVAFPDLLAIRQQHIIEEAVLDGRTESELDARIELLQSLSQQVCAGVPEGVLTFLILPFVEGKGSILHDGTVQLHCLPIHTAADDATCQGRRDALGNFESCHALLIRANRAVWKCNVNHFIVV